MKIKKDIRLELNEFIIVFEDVDKEIKAELSEMVNQLGYHVKEDRALDTQILPPIMGIKINKQKKEAIFFDKFSNLYWPSENNTYLDGKIHLDTILEQLI